MAQDILVGHGLVLMNNSDQGPSIKIEGWPERGSAKGGQGLITLTDIMPDDKDVVVPIVAVDDFRVLYTFGKDFGGMQIQGVIYLGCSAKKGFQSEAGSLVAEVKDAFDNNLRVSTIKKPVDVSMASGGGSGAKWKVAFTNIRFMQANPQHQTIPYVLSGLIIPPKSRN